MLLASPIHIFVICGCKKNVLKNALCSMMGISLPCICYVISIDACFCNVYVQSMCVPILRSIGSKLTNLEIACFI